MGKYVNDSLAPGETVVCETRYHWIIFLFWSSILTLGIAPLIARWSSEFVITNRRIVIKEGLIRRRTLELNVRQVESVGVDQSVVGRLLNYGTVTIVGSGGTREVFSHISHPIEFRRAYQQQL
jgi:uncharacterized membrane protein YdbT with pleckstrin-like domain